jgi:hypothetical protein
MTKILVTCNDTARINRNTSQYTFYIDRQVPDTKLLSKCIEHIFSTHDHTLYDLKTLSNSLRVDSLNHPNNSISISLFEVFGHTVYRLSIKGIKENSFESVDCICTSKQLVNDITKLLKKKNYAIPRGNFTYKDKILSANTQLSDCGFNHGLNDIVFKTVAQLKITIPPSQNIIVNFIGTVANSTVRSVNAVTRIVKFVNNSIMYLSSSDIPIEPRIVPEVDIPPVDSGIRKRKTIPKKIKSLVWDRYIGDAHGTAKCMCCHVTGIKQLEFHCGHVVSVANGGDCTVDNLRPVCSQCNLSMGGQNMDDFMKQYFKNNIFK